MKIVFKNVDLEFCSVKEFIPELVAGQWNNLVLKTNTVDARSRCSAAKPVAIVEDVPFKLLWQNGINNIAMSVWIDDNGTQKWVANIPSGVVTELNSADYPRLLGKSSIYCFTESIYNSETELTQQDLNQLVLKVYQ